MNLRLSAIVERGRTSLFLVPMVAVVVATVLGLGLLAVDRRVDVPIAELPLGFTSTVESARTLLGAIAGATISFAGIAFSVSMLILQLTASRYSPRVVQTLFRDPFNKRVMGLVVGTFTYCIVVLRSVRSALDDGGEAVIPNLSVAVAVILGIAAILAIVAFIDHNAHTVDVGEILGRIHRHTVGQIHATWEPSGAEGAARPAPPEPGTGPATTVRAERSGWIQYVDSEGMLAALPDGATVRVHTNAGEYAIVRSPLLSVSPPLDDDALAALGSAIVIGQTRTMDQDVRHGLRQAVDVATTALSPGINDPTTACDAISHAAAILSELLRRDPPAAVTARDDRIVVIESPVTHVELIRLVFDEPRQMARSQARVCRHLLDTLAGLVESLTADGFVDRTTELRRQARLVSAGCGRQELLAEDVTSVEQRYAQMIADGRL